MSKKKKEVKLEDVKDQVIEKIDSLWVKLDRDRRNSLYINEVVKEHLTWVESVVVDSTDTADYHDVLQNNFSMRGKLPHIYECAETLLSQYESSLFKTPDSMFNIGAEQDTEEQFATIQKYYILDKIDKAKIINAYTAGLEKQIWRGENILFHEWGKIKAKKRVAVPVLDDKNEPALIEDGEHKGQPKTEWVVQEYTKYEGPLVKAIEPHDFVFDTTKIGPFTSSSFDMEQFNNPACIKIKRTWASIEDIKNNDLYDISNEDIEKLEKSIETSKTPRTEQNFDDFTNRFNYRHTNGDMIEILEFLGNIKVKGQVLEDYRIITAASEVVLRFEESPWTRCPYVWMPDVVDITTRRGLSPLVVATDYNNRATEIFETTLEALKFAVNPAFMAKKGTHIVDDKKKLEPGDWVEIDDGLGNGEYPQEITSYKNIPMNFDFLTMFEKNIETVTGVTKYESGDATGIARTATETNQIITGSNQRFSRKLLIYCNQVLIPSIEIIATLIAENTHLNTTENVKVPNTNGQDEIKQVNDAIRAGTYSYTIGSTQALIEKKAKLNEMMPIVNGLQQNIQFDWNEFWNEICSIYEYQDPQRFLQSDPLQQALNKYPKPQQDQFKQALAHIASNPQLIQKAFAPAPQQQPQPNKIVQDIAAKAIDSDKALPDDAKQVFMQALKLQPTTEMLQKQQDVQQKQGGQLNANLNSN